MTYLVGIPLILFGLTISVVIHEGGHFLTARWFGMKASRFFAGFGPTIWSFRRGETEYGVKAIPAGGFVKIEGMTPLEEMDPAEEHRAMWRQARWKRVIVMAAGILTHMVLFLVLLWIAAGVWGVPVPTGKATVSTVEPCAARVSALAQSTNGTTAVTCPSGAQPSPAAAAGLQPGDTIVAVGGRSVSADWDASQGLSQSNGQPITLTVVRDGARKTLTVNPMQVAVAGQTAYRIGIELKYQYDTYGTGFVGGAVGAGKYFAFDTVETAHVLGKLPSQLTHLFSPNRSAQGVQGIVGVSHITGAAVTEGTPSQAVESYLIILASLNLWFGYLNLLPILPFDGGHIMLTVVEGLRARWAKLLGRADPGPLNYERVMPAMIAVFGAILVVVAVIYIADIVNPAQLPG